MKETKIVGGDNAGLGLGRRRVSRGESAGRRALARDSLFLMAAIRRHDEPEEDVVPARVRNLSKVGVMADYHGVADAGETVAITIRGIGEVSGKVAWVRGGRIGVIFDEAVDPKAARKRV
jgi:hypothetical protein